MYGRNADYLEKNLTKKDGEIIEDYLQLCGITAGKEKLKNLNRFQKDTTLIFLIL